MANILKRVGFLTPLAGLILLLVLINVLLSIGNQSLRLELNERQQFITQSIQLEAINREIVTVLVAVAVKNNDQQLKSLLVSQGVSLSADPRTAGGAK